MIERGRFGQMRDLVHGLLAVLCAAFALAGVAATAAASVRLQQDGSLQIGGRSLKCGSMRNVLDPDLPGLGLASRNMVVLNPELLDRYSPTVRLFVFHHECGHHHVGSDELAADCWAVRRGLRDGWLDKRDLTSICRSFGNARETDTHPAAGRRCASLERCLTAAASTKRELRPAERADMAPPAQTKPRPLPVAAIPATIHEPPLPIGLLVLVFVALVWAAAPRRRLSRDEPLELTGAR